MSEKRPIDRIDEAVAGTAEAAELAEHIQETEPSINRDLLFETLVDMIDDAHQECLGASVELDGGPCP